MLRRHRNFKLEIVAQGVSLPVEKVPLEDIFAAGQLAAR
jgi:hypothetical protein